MLRDTDNQQEIEEWLSDEIGKIEPQSKKEGKNVEATKEASAPFSPDEKIVKEEVKPIQKQPFHETKEVQKEKSSEDLKIPDSLEKALSSAIQKKQSESQYKKFEKTNEKEVDTKEETKSEENTEKPEKKEIKVRCPSCKKIFPVKKEGGVFKIKCPHCGKEGVAK